MINSLEKNLRRRISKKRNMEMKKYGRRKSYDKISNFLQDDKKITFSLINHALAIIDDDIDTSVNKTQLDRAILILTTGFQGKEILLKKDWEKDIFNLGKTLLKLQKNNFAHAKDVFYEVINYWKIEKQNLSRKNKILNSYDLDNLNLKIGKSVSLQFLYLLCPGLKNDIRESIASLYGFALKLADNLSDLDEDLEIGYINISEENIKKYGFRLEDLSIKDSKSFVKIEYGRIKKFYNKGDKVVEKILKQYPSQREGILIFKDIAYSWSKQVSEVYNTVISKNE